MSLIVAPYPSVLFHIFTLSALHIEAEVARWVYTVGSEKSRTDAQKVVSHQASGFFSSLFAGFGGSSSPRRSPTPAPVIPKEPIDLLEAPLSSVVLTIFGANVDVRLDKKMTAELLRSTKKNPPSRLRYELIYVGSLVLMRPFQIGSYVHLDGKRRI